MFFNIFVFSLIVLVCVLANKLSDRVGVPALLLFMGLGLLMGSNGIFRINFSNFELAEEICSITLIFIMFYGGFGTNWKAAKPVAVQAFILASVGVFLTAGAVGAFCHYALKFSWVEGLLIGSVISSTDAASVFAILRSKNLNLKNGLASMLEIESGSNDPFAYMLTVIFLGMLQGGSSTPVLLMIGKQVAFGLIIGIGLAKVSIYALRKVTFNSGMDTIFIVAVALLAYSLASLTGGNGYLSVYVAGIFLGNSDIRNKIALVHFFDGITGLMQFVLFFILGLLAVPAQLPEILIPSISVALFLTFIGRPGVIFLLLAPFKNGIRDKLLVSWAGLRGAASIVFAIMVTVSDVAIKSDIFHIVFCIAILSVLFQGTLLPVFAERLDLVDNEGSVLKTFTDYIDDSDMELVQLKVNNAMHPWAGMSLSEIDFPADSLVVMIDRGGEMVIPRGDTVLLEEDQIIISSKKYDVKMDIVLTEEHLAPGHKWVNCRIMDIDFENKAFIVMIKRDGDTIVPRGDTVLQANDTLVMRTA